MKQMRSLLHQLRQCCALKGRKTGSSLGMVMIVGTALVIWVMAIMPLMTTTGTTAIKTQNTQVEYLTARSSIEFSKSELEKIVETQIPYTFAVIKENSGKFSALPKKDGIMTNAAYQACVVEDATDDTKDVPEAGETGAKVAAICAVVPKAGNTTQYDIKISTFTEGEKNLTYSAVYTLNGSLLIYPEAYKQSEALPLSDFVLVDGKLGANEVWDSRIAWNASWGSVANDNYKEYLLSWKLNPDGNYANAGEYPAVFKKTAEAALNGESIGTAITEDPLTDAKWIKPSASSKDASDKVEGSMWIDISGSSAKVYMLAGGENKNITSSCKVYYNGEERTSLPKNSGIYTISVDYAGTGEYNTNAGAINVLPVQGVVLGSYEVDATDKKFDASGCKITDVEYEDGTCRVSLSNITGAWYGYTNKADGTEIQWQSGNTISVSANETWYFYCFCPAKVADGVWYDNSDVVYAGMIYPFEAVTSLEHGSQYIVMAENGGKYYAMNTSAGSTEYPRNTNSNKQYAGNLDAGVIVGEPSVDLAWTMMKTNPQSNSSTWQFVSSTKEVNKEIVADKGLKITQSVHWLIGYAYSLGISSLPVSNSEFALQVDEDGEATVTMSFEEKQIVSSKTVTVYTGYSSGFKGSTSNQNINNIYFIKVPVQGAQNVEAPIVVGDWDIDIEYTYNLYNNEGEYNWTQIKNLISQETGGAVWPDDIYLNGEYVSYEEVIDAGTYELIGYTANDDWKFGEEYYKLGTLTVNQAELTADYALTIEQDENDELKLTVTGSNWNQDNGGVKYIGYKPVAEDGTESEMNWFETTDGTINFRLDYGKYIFAMAESGTRNYSVTSYLETEVVEIKAFYVEITEDDKKFFNYRLEHDPEDLTKITVTWYDRLPDKITPSKITMVYGTPVGDEGISWSETYTTGVRFYGALIKGTLYETLDNVFQLPQPLGVTNENGRFSSLMKGSALYFMGKTNSINTYGNDIYLHTDLLVLKNGITGDGRVILNPYSTGDGDPGDTLVFFVNDMGNFKAKEFYQVPAGTDLVAASVGNAENVINMMVTDEDGTGTVGTDFADRVQYYFRNNIYPELNVDIAYAADDQLALIIAGETIGWTSDGVMSGSSNASNGKYAVCAFVSEVSGEVSRKANRILIAAKDSDTTYGFTVPADMKFTTRYLSVDADVIQGLNGAKLELWNLAQDSGFIEDILRVTGNDIYSSKTLQMDYERYTVIRTGEGETGRSKQICRYEDGTNILAIGTTSMPLLVDYTASEIEYLYSHGLSGLGAVADIVDRYVKIEDPTGSNDEITISSLFRSKLNIFANYLYVDSSIKKITFSGLLGQGSMMVNSQESGYSTEEYLSFFRQSTENYVGTLVYLEGPVIISSTWSRPKTVPQGFYFIYADSGDGTSLSDLVNAVEGPNAQKKPYKVPLESLKEYSVYISPDGSISDAYVDTGIYDNETAGLGGFTGGSMK